MNKLNIIVIMNFYKCQQEIYAFVHHCADKLAAKKGKKYISILIFLNINIHSCI